MKKIEDIRSSLQDIINFGDPINKILDTKERPSGIKIKKFQLNWCYRIIYESRPNVTIDAAAYVLNQVILQF